MWECDAKNHIKIWLGQGFFDQVGLGWVILCYIRLECVRLRDVSFG